MQGGVRCSVATAVEAVTGGAARWGGDGRGAAEHRERGLGSDPFGVVARGDQKLFGSDRRDTLGLHEGGVDCLDELGEVAVVRGDLLVELLVAGREAFERGPGAGSDLVVTGLGA